MHARRVSQGENVVERRKLTDGELRTLMSEASEGLNRKVALELEEDSLIEQKEGGIDDQKEITLGAKNRSNNK